MVLPSMVSPPPVAAKQKTREWDAMCIEIHTNDVNSDSQIQQKTTTANDASNDVEETLASKDDQTTSKVDEATAVPLVILRNPTMMMKYKCYSYIYTIWEVGQTLCFS